MQERLKTPNLFSGKNPYELFYILAPVFPSHLIFSFLIHANITFKNDFGSNLFILPIASVLNSKRAIDIFQIKNHADTVKKPIVLINDNFTI